LHALHRAYTSELHGTLLIKLRKPQPRFCHRVAHRAAHRWQPCEIGGVVETLRSKNVSDDEVVGEAGESVSRVGRVIIAALALLLTRASFLTAHRVGRVDGFVSASCASLLCASRLPRVCVFMKIPGSSPVAHFLMVRILTLAASAASERTRIRLRLGRLGILAHECSVHVCVFGRRWSCERPHACRHAARPPRKLSVFGGFRKNEVRLLRSSSAARA